MPALLGKGAHGVATWSSRPQLLQPEDHHVLWVWGSR